MREEVLAQERSDENQREPSARPTNLILPQIKDNGNLSKGKPSLPRESMNLMDQYGLANILRVLFIPDPPGKTTLNRLIVHLCANYKSRSELLNLLLAILVSEANNLVAVDRIIAHVTGKGRITSLAHLELNASIIEEIPHLITRRCLETLASIASKVPSAGKYFLFEQDQSNISKTPKSSKKGKGKVVVKLPVCPVVTLLNLLDNPYFLSNSILLEQLIHLLATTLRPLAHVAKKKFGSVLEAFTTTNFGKDNHHTADLKKKLETPNKEKSEIRMPLLPESSVKGVVNVLKDSTCSSKTFQYTLSVIQYLCAYPDNLNIVTRTLMDSARLVADSIVQDIEGLICNLKMVDNAGVLDPGLLVAFTVPSASQAKLLRILKTIDFLFSRDQAIILNQRYVTALPLSVSLISKIVAEFESSVGKCDLEMQILEELYAQLNFQNLWQKLGESMRVIGQSDNFIHVATVLLPFIEGFMVVSKPMISLLNRQHPNQQSAMSVPVRILSENQDSNDCCSFLHFAETNKKILNTMVRNNPSLMNGSFSLLVKNPKVLEFDNKRTYFNLQLHKSTTQSSHPQININVRRKYVFEESYQQLQGRTGDFIKYGKLNVRFRDEEGVDAGGVTREWFSALAMQMFNPDYALFRPSNADKVTYQPNRASEINPDHLFYFKFVGRIIGKAIYDGRLLDAYFTRSFYKCMINAPVDHKDMEAADLEFYKSLDWILHNDITDVLDLNFSIDLDDFGRQKIVELKPGGSLIVVTETNKIEYVKLVTEQRLVLAINDQIQAFLSGFNEIIPSDLVKIFNEQELELLISGLPDIDIDDWRNNTTYENYTSASPQIQWFWRAVRSFSQEERAKLLQFATGTSKVPLGGFAKLQGSTGIQKFQIHKEFSSTSRLPSAHTCFNQIDLPLYDSYEQLRSSVLMAVSECGFGFGFA